MLCKDNMDLFETMSCFEVMHKKMDARMLKGSVLGPKTCKRTVDLTQQER